MAAKKADQPGSMSPLARLIRQKQSNGLSFNEMERRALLAGHRFSASAFGQVAGDERARRLDVKSIAAIAAGLGETPDRIRTLDDERHGIVGPSDEGDDLRYQRPPGLTDEAWARIRAEAQDYIDYQLSKAAQER